MPMRSRVKLADVARAAGVSPATVSRVLNGNDRVDQELAERVRKAQEELGYRGNSLARGLRRRENNVIGVLVPDVTNPFFTNLVRSLEDVLREHGHLLVLCNTDETPSRENEYLSLLADQQVAGIVVAPVRESSTMIPDLARGRIPIVAVDREIEDAEIDTVIFDNFEGARRLTEILLGDNDRVATIMGPLRTSTASGRLAGYRAALSKAGRSPDDEWVIESDYSERGGYEAALELLRAKHRPDAIFSGNNLMTLGVIRAMGELGLTSSDVALASFTMQSESLDPRFEVVSLGLGTYEMGRIAAELLMARITGEGGGARRVVLPVSEIRR